MIVASLIAVAISVVGLIGILVLANRGWAEQDARLRHVGYRNVRVLRQWEGE